MDQPRGETAPSVVPPTLSPLPPAPPIPQPPAKASVPVPQVVQTPPPPPSPTQLSNTSQAGSSEYAGFGTRLLATLIDTIILGVISGVIVTIASIIGVAAAGPKSQPSSQAGLAIGGVLVFAYILIVIIWVGYSVYFIGGSGQTLGKKVVKIRVVRKDGNPVGYGYALLRETIGKYISALVFDLGYLWMLWDQDKQTWHDKIAGTVVVKS